MQNFPTAHVPPLVLKIFLLDFAGLRCCPFRTNHGHVLQAVSSLETQQNLLSKGALIRCDSRAAALTDSEREAEPAPGVL